MSLSVCFLVFVCLFCFLNSVQSHITFYPNNSPPGTSLYAWLQVPHGCDDADTEQIIATFPPDFTSLQPEDKYRWNIEAKQIKSSTGAPQYQLTYTAPIDGPMKAHLYHRLGFKVTVPKVANNTKYYIPVIQTCINGVQANWTALPPVPAGADPAPSFSVFTPWTPPAVCNCTNTNTNNNIPMGVNSGLSLLNQGGGAGGLGAIFAIGSVALIAAVAVAGMWLHSS